MTHLRYFTTTAVERLRDSIIDRLDWYYAPTDTLPEFPDGGNSRGDIASPEPQRPSRD